MSNDELSQILVAVLGIMIFIFFILVAIFIILKIREKQQNQRTKDILEESETKNKKA